MLEKFLTDLAEMGLILQIWFGAWFLGTLSFLLNGSKKAQKENYSERIQEFLSNLEAIAIYSSFIMIPALILWVLDYLS